MTILTKMAALAASKDLVIKEFFNKTEGEQAALLKAGLAAGEMSVQSLVGLSTAIRPTWKEISDDREKRLGVPDGTEFSLLAAASQRDVALFKEILTKFPAFVPSMKTETDVGGIHAGFVATLWMFDEEVIGADCATTFNGDPFQGFIFDGAHRWELILYEQDPHQCEPELPYLLRGLATDGAVDKLTEEEVAGFLALLDEHAAAAAGYNNAMYGV